MCESNFLPWQTSATLFINYNFTMGLNTAEALDKLNKRELISILMSRLNRIEAAKKNILEEQKQSFRGVL